MTNEWTDADADALEQALAPLVQEGGALGYCELAGFLFAVACSPEVVMPSEWILAALGDEPDEFGDIPQLIGLVMRLYNHVNDGVFTRDPALPAGIEVFDDPGQNFGDTAPLGRWCRGYAEGQQWLEETWDALLPAQDDGEESPDEVLGSLAMTLSFFADREVAEEFHGETRNPDPFGEFARQMLEWHADAMLDLAVLGRNIAEAEQVAAQGPAQSTKVGRNEPCPCGSGKKYKFCCGAAN